MNEFHPADEVIRIAEAAWESQYQTGALAYHAELGSVSFAFDCPVAECTSYPAGTSLSSHLVQAHLAGIDPFDRLSVAEIDEALRRLEPVSGMEREALEASSVLLRARRDAEAAEIAQEMAG